MNKEELASAPPAPQPSNCSECRNADSWGLPDKNVCRTCAAGSAWEPLNKSSVNPHQQAPQAPQSWPLPGWEVLQAARCELCQYQHGHQIGCANNPVDIALKAQAQQAEKPENFWDDAYDDAKAAVVQQEPEVGAMTAQRAAYFMERFKHEEKLLGPNEQAAVDFVLAMLNNAAPKAAPQPLSDEQIEKGRQATFSTNNPFCPCDSKTMRKAVRWAEAAHGIKE